MTTPNYIGQLVKHPRSGLIPGDYFGIVIKHREATPDTFLLPWLIEWFYPSEERVFRAWYSNNQVMTFITRLKYYEQTL